MTKSPILTRKEYFLSDEDVRELLGLAKQAQIMKIVKIERRTFAWGKDKRATLDNLGYVVSVIEPC